MSDSEFDNYLALLCRLLRLGSKQRDAIAGELRAHLEDRLDELVSRGVPRDEAVRQALEEFGDAAAMAAEFVAISRNKRKRWIMRLTTASAAAMVLIAAGIFTFWPGNNAGPGAAAVVAQAPDQPAQDAAGKAKGAEQNKEVSIKDTLDRRMAFEYDQIPLNDVVRHISAQAGIMIHLDAKRLEEAGVSVDAPVTIAFQGIRLSTFLDLMLGDFELNYLLKDDVLVITTQEDAENQRVIRVYDCRELLELPRPAGSIRPKVIKGGGGLFAVQDEPPRKSASAAGEAGGPAPTGGGSPSASASVPMGGLGGGGSGEIAAQQAEISDAENLIDFITTTVDTDTWTEMGGPGSIAEYKGLISVASTQEVHKKVERLLNMLHQAANLKELKVTVVE